MPTFSLRFERYVQRQCVVEIQADTLDAAIAHAAAFDTDALEWDEPDWSCATRPRLYSAEQSGDVVSRVAFADDNGLSWTSVCLTEQWSRALEAPLACEELAVFAEAAAAHYSRLIPELNEEWARDLTSSRLRAETEQVAGEEEPRRVRL